MACFKPLRARKTESGFRVLSKDGPDPGNASLPCGRCIGCQLDYSRQWAVRCCHEASLYDENSYLTLTYNAEHLPPGGSLEPRDFTLFMKKLRKRVAPVRIRFFMCGEYGDELERPHYHALLFNFDFPDKELLKVDKGQRHYRSDLLDKIWGNGFCTIGAVSFESAAYVARYVLKKRSKNKSPAWYLHVDEETGEIVDRYPEYIRMSNHDGIGKAWFEKHSGDCFPDDFVTLAGRKYKVPRYYDKLLGARDEEALAGIKEERVARMAAQIGENTPERLEVREKVQQSKAKRLIRRYESGTEDF